MLEIGSEPLFTTVDFPQDKEEETNKSREIAFEEIIGGCGSTARGLTLTILGFPFHKIILNEAGIISPNRDGLIRGAKERLTLSVASNSKNLNNDQDD